jgi:hypothetical protein
MMVQPFPTMSAFQSAAVDAIGFQLLAALDECEADTEAMVEAWPELDRYHTVSAHVERIRMFCAARPELRVQWAELLIAHAELIHHLWRAQYGKERPAGEQLAQARAHHTAAIESLTRQST